MKIDDLQRLRLVSDPKISPSNRWITFTVTKPNIDDDKYESSIWLLDLNKMEYDQLTSGPFDSQHEWAPDSKRIAFISRRTFKEDEKGGEIWIMNIEKAGEPRLLLKRDQPVLNLRWSLDGRSVLFISRVGREDEDVKEIDEIPIWFNGEGFVYNIRKHLFILDIESENYLQATDGDFNVIMAEWSPNGRYIGLVLSERKLQPYINDIYVLDLKSGEKENLTKGMFTVYSICWSPDGRYIAFKGHDLSRGLSTHRKIYIIDTSKGEIELLTKIDKDLINAINSDIRGPSSGKAVQWVGGHVYFHLSNGGSVSLYRCDLDGRIEAVLDGKYTVEDYYVSDDLIALIRMDPVNPTELFIYKNRNLYKITSFNDSLLAQIHLNTPEHFMFEASDGEEIEGWVLKPYNFRKGRRYPGILYIHGGPATTYGHSFIHEFHVLSGEGYVLIYTNPRGSTGYSQEFRDIRSRYGDRDYKDLMEALDYAISKYDFIDRERLGVTGGSYGGFMTNWIIGHTDRFGAAVTQRSISNWISKFGTTDIGFYFNADQIAGGFDRYCWEDGWFIKYWDHSPLKYAKNVKTPLLIIHSVEDYRCWLDQAIQMFTSLKLRGIPSKLILFPKENHDLSRKGKPRHRIKRLETIIKWFDKYLKT